MGAVYRARDVQLGRWVAVKCLLDVSKETSRELAAKEARTLASLNHRNIMRVFDILQSGDQVWIVSEWLEGKSLAQMPLPLPPASVLAIMAQIYDALAYAHAAQVIHRDVKPANIILGVEGRVTLIDFGVAFAPGSSTGETLVGSLRYTDPRILEGEPPDAASDLFSAALLQVELMTGETVLPDMAPLPLYRHIKKHLRPRVDQMLDGCYPPLVELARASLKRFERGAPSTLTHDALEVAAQTVRLLRGVTPLTPDAYLAATLGNTREADPSAEAAIALELEAALVDPALTPRQKAPWYAFKAQRRPDAAVVPMPRPSLAPSRARSRARQRADAHLSGRKLFLTVATVVVLALLGVFAGKRRIAPRPLEETPSAVAVEESPLPSSPLPSSAGTTQRGVTIGADPQQPLAGGADSQAARRGAADPQQPHPGATLATDPQPPARPELVPLHLAANAWAVVVIDGKEAGRLPQAAPFLVAPGHHDLRLENPTVEALATEIDLAAGSSKKLHFTLRPKKAAPRTIKLGVPGRLFVDGVDHGIVQSKTLTLSYGTHEVSIRRGNRVIKQKHIALGPDSPRDIIVE